MTTIKAHNGLRRIIAIVLLCIFAVSPSIGAEKDFVIVIDPGHGGTDPGALGTIVKNGRRVDEKDINLAVSLLLGKKIEEKFDDVKVLYTRDTDKKIAYSHRTKVANDNNANLFISIHANSAHENDPNRKSRHGAMVITFGVGNEDDKTKRDKIDDYYNTIQRENSVIELEPDYTTRYQDYDPNATELKIVFDMKRRRIMDLSINFAQSILNQLVSHAGRENLGIGQRDNIYILRKCGMPAVLVELDYISNPAQERYMNSKEGQEELATAILNAITEYKAGYDEEMRIVANATMATNRENHPTQTTSTGNDCQVIYKVQFLTSSKKIKRDSPLFKGLSPVESYKESSKWKYTYGETSSKEDADMILRNVREKFPDAFIIKTINGKRID